MKQGNGGWGGVCEGAGLTSGSKMLRQRSRGICLVSLATHSLNHTVIVSVPVVQFQIKHEISADVRGGSVLMLGVGVCTAAGTRHHRQKS